MYANDMPLRRKDLQRKHFCLRIALSSPVQRLVKRGYRAALLGWVKVCDTAPMLTYTHRTQVSFVLRLMVSHGEA